MKYIVILFLLTFSMTLLFIRRRRGRLLYASVISSAVFAVSSLIYLISFGFYREDVSLSSVIVIVGCLLLIFAGEEAAALIPHRDRGFRPLAFCNIRSDSVYSVRIPMLVVCCAVMTAVLAVRIVEVFSLADSIGNFRTFSEKMAAVRAYNVTHVRRGSSILVSQAGEFSFCSFIVWTCMFFYNRISGKGKANFAELIPAVLYFFQLFFMTSRIEYIKAFVFIVAFIAFISYRFLGERRADKKILIWSACSVAAFLLIFLFVGIFTYGAESGNGVVAKISKYSSSSLLGLSRWLESGSERSGLFAENTLRNIYLVAGRFGFDTSGIRIHWDFFSWDGGESNIYTAIAPLISDFGAAVSVFFFSVGFAVCLLSRSILENKDLNIFVLFIASLFLYPVVVMSVIDDFNVLITTSLIYDLVYIPAIFLLGFARSEKDACAA